MGTEDRHERYRQLVERVFDVAAASADPATAQAVASWLVALEQWNRKIDLTAAQGERELVDLMVADAAVLAPYLTSGGRVVDVGTGAGAPGLPLSLLRRDVHVTLVEPKQKRVAFLRHVLGRIALGEEAPLVADVVRARADELGERRFDVALSRATLSPAEWLAQGARLAPEGEVWILLARQRAPELEGWQAVHDFSYRWPLTASPRRAVCYRRPG